MNSKENTLLVVNNLSIGFESYNRDMEKIIIWPISNLSVSLNKGEILAIVGSSGSGKSLLAHAVMDILPDNAISKGDIFYKKNKLDSQSIVELRGKKIVFIPQSVSFLDPLMEVGKQVCGIMGDAVKNLQEKAFEHFNLKKAVEKYYPFQLSGGMARRVLLSTALVTDAELIIADEPTPGLDLSMAIEALKDFRELANQGKGVVLITHDIDLAINIADKIAIFYDGRVVETAETKYFKENGDGLKHPYSKALFQALPQNGFHLEKCPECGLSSAVWKVDEKEMRCECGRS